MKRILVLLASLALAVVIAGGVALAAPNSKTFANRNTIVINDATVDPATNADIPSNATPYPSTIDVTGLTGQVQDVNLTLKGFSHTFPGDVSVMLEDPHGNQSEVMRNVGGGTDVKNIALTLDDEATNEMLFDIPLSRGTYLPLQPLSVFDTFEPNGTWKLYVQDNFSDDSGKMSGWSLQIASGN